MRYLSESEKHVKKAILVATISATTENENNLTTAGLVQALQRQQGTDITAVVPVNTAQMTNEQYDLFALMDNSTTSAHLPISCVVDEIDKYLNSAYTSMENLIAYSHFLKVFIKYNSSLIPAVLLWSVYLAVRGRFWG